MKHTAILIAAAALALSAATSCSGSNATETAKPMTEQCAEATRSIDVVQPSADSLRIAIDVLMQSFDSLFVKQDPELMTATARLMLAIEKNEINIDPVTYKKYDEFTRRIYSDPAKTELLTGIQQTQLTLDLSDEEIEQMEEVPTLANPVVDPAGTDDPTLQ